MTTAGSLHVTEIGARKLAALVRTQKTNQCLHVTTYLNGQPKGGLLLHLQ